MFVYIDKYIYIYKIYVVVGFFFSSAYRTVYQCLLSLEVSWTPGSAVEKAVGRGCFVKTKHGFSTVWPVPILALFVAELPNCYSNRTCTRRLWAEGSGCPFLWGLLRPSLLTEVVQIGTEPISSDIKISHCGFLQPLVIWIQTWWT